MALNSRWNSSYYLIESIVKTRPALVQTLSNIENPPVEFQSKDFTLMNQVLKVLEPFEEATRDLSNHDASISMAIPTVTTIMTSLEVELEDQGVKGLKRSLKKAMDERFISMESKLYYTIATFLDAKFKQHFFMSPDTADRTKATVVEMLIASLGTVTEVKNNLIHNKRCHPLKCDDTVCTHPLILGAYLVTMWPSWQ